jgi:hypothetical protein
VTLRTDILLAISEVHSGNRDEGERIADAALAALRQWLADADMVIVPRETLNWHVRFTQFASGEVQSALDSVPDALRAEGE